VTTATANAARMRPRRGALERSAISSFGWRHEGTAARRPTMIDVFVERTYLPIGGWHMQEAPMATSRLQRRPIGESVSTFAGAFSSSSVRARPEMTWSIAPSARPTALPRRWMRRRRSAAFPGEPRCGRRARAALGKPRAFVQSPSAESPTHGTARPPNTSLAQPHDDAANLRASLTAAGGDKTRRAIAAAMDSRSRNGHAGR